MDGIIIINKPKGCTSHDIVHKAKKIFNEKVGHTGTLDPMATGVLPLLIGKGTLCSKYLIEHDKIYKAIIIETKGEIYANDPVFKEKRSFMEQEFIKQNNQQFGYKRFDYLYLEDTMLEDERIKLTNAKIIEFFKE